MRRIHIPLKKLWRERRATVAVLFVMTLIPILGMVGLAIDYGSMARAKAELDAAAHSAAMIAVTTAATSGSTSQGQAAGQQWLTAETTKLGFQIIAGNSAPVSVSGSGGGYNSTVAFSTNVGTYIGKMFKVNQFQPNISASATTSGAAAIDVIFMLDISPSMWIGATPSDISQMRSKLSGCAFACHNNMLGGPDNWTIVRANPGIQLRLDKMEQEAIAVLNSLSSDSRMANARVAVYTFDKTLKSIFPLSTNWGGAAAQINAINAGISNNPSLHIMPPDLIDHTGETEMESVMGQMTQIVTNLQTADPSRKQAVIMLTDGVNEPQSPIADPIRINQQVCTTLKSKAFLGITQLQYFPLYNNPPTNYNLPSPLGDGDDPTYRWMALGVPIIGMNTIAMFQYSNPTYHYLDYLYSDMQQCASASGYSLSDGYTNLAGTVSQLLGRALQGPGRFTQ